MFFKHWRRPPAPVVPRARSRRPRLVRGCRLQLESLEDRTLLYALPLPGPPLTPNVIVTPPADQTVPVAVAQPVQMGSFTDTGGSTSWSANIAWGDGASTSIPTLSARGAIPAQAHAYVNVGTYTVTGTVTNSGGITSLPVTFHTTAIADLVANGASLGAIPGTPFINQVVANFTDSGGAQPVANYSATIDWGDNSRASGSIGLSGSLFTITGSHTYAQTGTFPITVTINRGAAPPVAVTSVANVLNPTNGDLNTNFVTQLYFDLLRRAPDPGGLNGFTNALNQGTSRTQVIQTLLVSPEYLGLLVGDQFLHLLHRAADPVGLSGFRAFLAGGGTVEQVDMGIAGSPEYFLNRGGNTNKGFVDALYEDALARPADVAGETAWVLTLVNGLKPAQVAAGFYSSREYLLNLGGSFYQRFLQRGADAGGLNGFVNALQHGGTDQQILTGILNSREYYFDRHQSTVLPLTPITIPGHNLDPTAPTFVIFTDDTGHEIKVQAAAVTESSVVAAVPFLTDPNTFQITSGTVSVSLEQHTNQGVITTAPLIQNLNVTGLPTTDLAPGTLTLAYLAEEQAQIDSALNEYQTIAGASNGTVDISPLAGDLQSLKDEATAEEQVLQPLVAGQVQQVDLGKVIGTEVVVHASDLVRIDGTTVISLSDGGAFPNAQAASLPCASCGMDLFYPQTGGQQPQAALAPEQSVAERLASFLDKLAETLEHGRITDLLGRSNSAIELLNSIEEGTVPAAVEQTFGALDGIMKVYTSVTAAILKGAVKQFITTDNPDSSVFLTTVADSLKSEAIKQILDSVSILSKGVFNDALGFFGKAGKALTNYADLFGVDLPDKLIDIVKNLPTIIANLHFPTPSSPGELSTTALNTFLFIQYDSRPETQCLTVSNLGGRTVHFSVQPQTPSHIVIEDAPVPSLGAGESQGFRVEVFAGDLKPGTYHETITVSSADTTQQITVPVTIVVGPLPLRKPNPPAAPPTPPPPSSFSNVNAGFTSTVFNYIYYRPPTAQESQTWVTQLNNGLPRGQMVETLEHTPEHQRIIVDVLYNLFLGRAPEPGALDNWTNFLDSGGTLQQMEEALVGSPEFFRVQGGGTDDGFLQAIYQDALGRVPDAGGQAAFDQQLAAGANPANIASNVLTSPEYLKDQVQSFYMEFLHRPADASGLASYVQLLLNGNSLEGVIADLMSSPEFFPLPPPPPPPPPQSNPFAGSYSGSYTGTGSAGGFTVPVSGAVAFNVDTGGHITVTVPGGGSGTVSSAGVGQIAGVGGIGSFAGASYSFSGTFVLSASGGVSARGSWSATVSGGTASGSWVASR